MNNAIGDNKQPLVSVIVPIYGVEKYVHRCVKSLIEQQYQNLEIILVDDGSKDRSGTIIDEMAKENDKIVVIHQDNMGVSVARNTGLKNANGEFVLFVDGDDYVERDYVSYFVNAAIEYNVDMVVNINNFTATSNNQVASDEMTIWKDTDIIKGIYLGSIFVAVWNKLYRKSILEENNICFHTDIWYGEGMLFNIEYLQVISFALVGKRKVYHQIYNPYSAMRKFSLESNLCGIRSLEIQKELWKKVTPEIELAWKYHYRNFSQSIICGLVSIDAVEEHKELYRECISNMRHNISLPWKVQIPIGDKLRLTLFAIMPRIIANRRKRKAKEKIRIQEELLSRERNN